MIEHPTGTLCRCGVSLDLCADCRGWLSENALRIEFNIGSWWRVVTEYDDIQTDHFRQYVRYVDAAETDDLAYFESRR